MSEREVRTALRALDGQYHLRIKWEADFDGFGIHGCET